MYKNLLPIGSVVLLKGGEKRIMITSRIITRAGSDDIFDYAACYYPEGVVDPKDMVFLTEMQLILYFLSAFKIPKSLNSERLFLIIWESLRLLMG